MTILFSTAPETPRQDRATIGLVPVLALCTFIAMVHGMVLAQLIPAISDDIRTSVALLGQVPAVSMLLAGALVLSLAAALIVWTTRPRSGGRPS